MAAEENGTDTNTSIYEDVKLPVYDNQTLLQKEPKAKRSNSNLAADPCMFAPTGDIYSYFERRPIMPLSSTLFQYPLRYAAIKALSGSVSVK